ncbi:MAG: peptidylprolyl isomerase [Oceanospirillaceae bacterium]|nr:peptidylprolyl isomerase [Oceanospirillaceae bacterium]MCP5335511.1 peptidylprolyl isomerase [Oceanospirillaceae bacterium]MCP5349982.1 peptidylprolyl isomerase [Oceanospirillaceae bacterium]
MDIHARHILLKTPLLVQQVLQALNDGADFASIAREYSACPSASAGGELGQMDETDFPPALCQALALAQPHEIVGPVSSRHGIHLLQKLQP